MPAFRAFQFGRIIWGCIHHPNLTVSDVGERIADRGVDGAQILRVEGLR
jgi:hypothetical protein